MTLSSPLRVSRQLGEGSYGTIHEAHSADGAVVALKLLRRDRQTQQMISRFRQEAAALGACGPHPHVVGLALPLHEHEGTLAFAMEFLPGGDLTGEASDVLAVGKALAEALDHIHARGFLHRDLSLKNVLRDEAGLPHLCDFGLCRPLERQEGDTPNFWFAHGDPEFAAPERLFHIESGEAGDAYSLGAVLHRLATRQSLFALGQLSYLYNVYTRQMEQFFRTCINQGLPCPKVDFRSVYDFYLTRAPSLERAEFIPSLTETQRVGLHEVLADLLEADYWKRLRRFGSLAKVAERLGEVAT